MKALLITIIGCILLLAGCGEGEVITDPNTITALETTADAAVTLTQVLGAFWPALIPIGTGAAGILAAYKRLKPKIAEAKADNEKFYAAGEAVAMALEDLKTNEPAMWATIGPMIKESTAASADIENTIRGFRHLEPIGT